MNTQTILSTEQVDRISQQLVDAGFSPLTDEQRNCLLFGDPDTIDMLDDFIARLGVDVRWAIDSYTQSLEQKL